jgi:hypothetical protein
VRGHAHSWPRCRGIGASTGGYEEFLGIGRRARFIGEANRLPVTLTPDGADAGALGLLDMRGHSYSSESGAAVALIRPEQITVQIGHADNSGGHVPGTVEHCDYFGHDMMISVRMHAATSTTAVPESSPQPLPLTLLARLPAGTPLAVGTAVTLAVRGPVTTWATSD